MRAVVVEDSRLAREGLIRMLKQHPSIEIVGEAEHPEEARVVIAEKRPDLLFLDIHMPGESGFQLLESLNYSPKIIFTTAYADYAIQSFEHRAIDYLLKPISEERLAAAIEKLNNIHCESTAVAQSESPLDIDSRIFVKDNANCYLIPLKQIQYIESCKNYVQIFFIDSSVPCQNSLAKRGSNLAIRKAFVKKSLNLVEARLPIDIFFRVSRQYLVNLNAISKIDPSIKDGYDLVMNDGQVIEVSRRNAARFKDLLSL